jgi:Ca-activated chloride channel family protein
VLFGEANPEELQTLADVTGGKVFDGRSADLSSVFKEIRGYQ